ncbi:hypothetical protein G7046_g2338 [Stylonectria norvegica]|nr:hypothetical protein G7046_g2338 [Stylonectria norvegica]
MDCLRSFCACLPGHGPAPSPLQLTEKTIVDTQPVPYSDDAAAQIVETLRTTEKRGIELEEELNSIVSIYGWTEKLAERVLDGIEKMLALGGKMASAITEAGKKATAVAEEFAKKHPYYAVLIAAGTIIALGVLAYMLAPWFLEALGFARAGPRLGTFAARWMSKIARGSKGAVEKGTIYAYLQRLGMVWK